jgi:hypothetical protein
MIVQCLSVLFLVAVFILAVVLRVHRKRGY